MVRTVFSSATHSPQVRRPADGRENGLQHSNLQRYVHCLSGRADDKFGTMWRRGSRLIVKGVFIWLFLAAFHFWKRTFVSDWRANTSTQTHVRDTERDWELYVADDTLLKSKGGLLQSPHKTLDLARDDGGLQWIKLNAHDKNINGRDRNLCTWRNYIRDLSHLRLGVVTELGPPAAAGSRQLLSLAINCTPRAVEQFPGDFMTGEQRKQGLIIIHVLVAVYMFMGLALVCDRYFIPSLEILCELLKMKTDIAGATLMAAGSSAPELATSVIGVFVAQDDVGLGAVVGSAIYNVMFVISMCALFATSTIHLHWWPMVRDCVAYLLSVLALIFIIYDSVVEWYEAVILIVMYGLYVMFMYFNERLEVWCVPRVNMGCCCCSFCNHKSDVTIIYNKLPTNGSVAAENGETTHLTGSRESDEESSDDREGFIPPPKPNDHAHQEAETWHKLCERPEGFLWSVLWFLALPLSTTMFLTVPDCRRPSLRKWFLVTFLLSLVWLSAFSFLMVWMITIIGYTANIPDSVMSLTFIAFGVSLPDVVASVLVVRDGLGDMAVSNAIGSNVFDILVCLGIPWFLQTCVTHPGSKVQVYSEGLVYSSLMLLSTVALLLIVTHINGWRLTKKYGIFLLVIYVVYSVLACLYEINVFGYFHPPECPSNY